jgi:hypothetical protein
VPVTPAIILIYTCGGRPGNKELIFQGIIADSGHQGPDQVSKYITAPVARGAMEDADVFLFFTLLMPVMEALRVVMTRYYHDQSSLHAKSEEMNDLA